MADPAPQATPPELPSGPWSGAPAPDEKKPSRGRTITLFLILVVGVVFVGLRYLVPSEEEDEESGSAPAAPGMVAAPAAKPAAKPLSTLEKLVGKKEVKETPEEAARRAQAARAASVTQYDDALGYFTAMFPKGYAVIDQSGEKGTRVQLDYGRGVSMTIIAIDLQGEWSAGAELTQKVVRITQGLAGLPPELKLARSGIVEFGGWKGFETVLSGVIKEEPVTIHSYTLAGNGVSLQLALTCRNPNNMRKYEQVEASITESLKVGSGIAAPGESAGPAQAAAPTFTQAEWDLARKSLRTEGILKKGNAYAALVNGRLVKEGDVVSVYSKGEKFRFVVTSIQPKDIVFEPTTED